MNQNNLERVEESKIEKIGAIVVIIILGIMLIASIADIIATKLYKSGIENPIIKFLANEDKVKEYIVNIDWKAKYPFEKDEDNNVEENSKDILTIYLKGMNNIKNKLNAGTTVNLPYYEKIVESSYIYDKTINYTLASNQNELAKVKLYGDYWGTISMPLTANIEKVEKDIEKFGEFTDNIGANLLYVQAPIKIEKNSPYLSNIYLNVNIAADYILNEIENKIDYLDLRSKITKTGEEYLKLFFKTDHHWTPRAGIWATGEIIDELNSRYNYGLDKTVVSDINNYNIETYYNSYLGSEGRSVTLFNAKPEDFEVITPKFDTELHVNIPERQIDKTGTASETLYDRTKLIEKNPYKTDNYAVYTYGNKALVEIENMKVRNGIKLLVLKDSFANVISPFLSLTVQNYSIIDTRYFKGSVKNYIKEYKPDTILIITFPSSLGDGTFWHYN